MTRARELADLLTGGQTITTDDNTTQLTLTSTDADASVGPVLDLVRDSGSPADSDLLGSIKFIADDDGGNATTFASVSTQIGDASDGTESSALQIKAMNAGSLVSRADFLVSETVFNNGSIDLDFRVESNGNANMLVVDAGNDRIGIGTNTPAHDVEIVVTNAGSVNDSLQIRNNATSSGTGSRIRFINSTDSNSDANGASIHSVRNGDDNDLVFETENVERMKILAGGNVDISAGHILFDNGYGIDFSAAASASGMTSEILDDYEEGTFTPVFSSGITSAGYSSQVGTYVKVSAMVICSIKLRANSGTENSDHIRIGGLPFAFTSATDHAYGAFFTYNGGFWTSDINVQWLGLDGNTTLAFYQQSNGGSIAGTNSNVAANLNADCRLTVVYRTDS